jgi:glycosyltransferase involved in cell wall biosynthesis
MVKDAVINTLKKHNNVKFVFFGDMRFKKLFESCDQSKIEWQPWVPHNAYPYKLALMNIDIGLCPLVDNVFNRNKSAIKWMEYSVVGAATIASNIPPYSKVITDTKDGVLVSDDKWENALDDLINNKYHRDNLAESAYESVYQTHNIDTKVNLWHETYMKLLKPEPVGA